MTILHVVIDGEFAGGQLVALRLIEGARAAGHRCLIVSPSAGPFTERARAAGVDVHVVDVGRLHRLGGLLALRRILRVERVDVVHTHAMVAANVLSRIAGLTTGVPVISHVHSAEVFRAQRLVATLYRALDRATARRCLRLIAVSDVLREQLVRDGLPERLLLTVHNGYDPPAGRLPDPRGGLGLAGARLVTCVGRLEPAKGQADLIRAAVRFPEASLVLVGRDVAGHRAELEELSRVVGVADRVCFAGERDDVPALLAASEVVVLPSWSEGFPLVPLEAMGQARPVVATAVGGTGEAVLDGETGLLVPPHDPARLGDAVARLLHDPDLARRLGEAGAHRLRSHFSADSMVRSVLAVYEGIDA